MRTGRSGPSSIRWRLALALDPEMVALALTILFALAVLLVLRPGSPSSNPENRSPDPSFESTSSRSVPWFGVSEVAASIEWPGEQASYRT
jgi:hypothetical protein